ncbi:M15 family metallopeptidase [Kineothrix sedimenti]|uniref:M15 family metallopeptidase n=1 Tax=Kineothrix sedimenti TaxID=3123317 RepID=UPI003182D754
MKEYSSNDDINRHKHKPRKKLRRKARFRRKRLFLLALLACYCLAATMLGFGLLSNNEPVGEDKQPKILNSAVETNDTDFHANSISNEENKLDKTDAEETAWCLILVNKWSRIPDGYEVELTELADGQCIDKRIYPALQEMFDAARSDNIYPIVASGYRTTQKQQNLMDEKVAEYQAEGYSFEEATTKAEEWVAIPGTSEHQLGLGVDINADGIYSTGEEVYEWLSQNSYKFGFILRYPAGKTDITGVINEPWHYRYVGMEAAADIYNQGICLEEYLNKTN